MAARDRAAFRDVTTVSVLCQRCRVRLAEVFPISSAAGPRWDGMVFAEDGPSEWRCQTCDKRYPVDDARLHHAIADAKGDPPRIVLSDAPARHTVRASRDW